MSVAIGEDLVQTIYVDPPFQVEPASAPSPAPKPRLQPGRWRFYFPWVKTAVSAPTYNGELLIANRTHETWVLWHNYHNLGLLDPGAERQVRLVRKGTVSARKLVADADAEYLLLQLSPHLCGVEIVDLSAGEGFYTLRSYGGGSSSLESLPDSAPIKGLGFSAKTERALRGIGIATAGQLKRADLGELWDMRNGPAAYAEVMALLFPLDSLREG